MKYKLSDIFELQMGKTPERNNKEFWDDGTEAWISISDIGKCHKYIENTSEKITQTAVNESGIKVIPKDTVIMSFKLSIGKVAITAREMYSNEAIMAFINKDIVHITPTYLYYLLRQKNWDVGTNKAVLGKTLNKATLSQISINIHNINEQMKIVDVLDKVSSVIENRKQQLSEMDNLVKARFVEMFGDISFNDYKVLKEQCLIITDGTHQPPNFTTEGIPFLFVSNIASNKITYDTTKFITEETYTELIKRTPIEIGDVLLSTVGSYGHPAVVENDIRFCFQRHIAYLKPNKNIINSYYLQNALLFEDVQRQIDEKVKGIAQKTLNLSEIKALRIPLPSLEYQEQFADFVQQIDKSKVVVQKALDEAQTLFDSLMQEYFG